MVWSCWRMVFCVVISPLVCVYADMTSQRTPNVINSRWTPRTCLLCYGGWRTPRSTCACHPTRPNSHGSCSRPTCKKWDSGPDLGTWEMRSAGRDEWEGGNNGRSHNGIINGKLDKNNGKASGGLLNILWTTRKDVILL